LVTNKAIFTILGAIVAIAYAMDYGNTFREFATWTMSVPPSDTSRLVYEAILGWFQPIIMAGYAVPLALVVLLAFVFGIITAKH